MKVCILIYRKLAIVVTAYTGLITLENAINPSDNLFPGVPLEKKLDDLDIYIDKNGALVLGEGLCGVECCSMGAVGKIAVSKSYAPHITKDGVSIALRWSLNSFTDFFIQILQIMDGIPRNEALKNDKFRFGRIYDKQIKKKTHK